MDTTPPVFAVPTPDRARSGCGMPSVDFCDAFQGTTRARPLALEAARAAFESPPPFVGGLMAARNRIVSLFGLKTPKAPGDSAGLPQAGIFPILQESPERVVLGLDDKHLDFRIWLEVRPQGEGSDVLLATLIRYRNVGGRLYLATILPFHKLLSRLMLARALKSLDARAGP